jgi:small-conductance mechanosensitive channel
MRKYYLRMILPLTLTLLFVFLEALLRSLPNPDSVVLDFLVDQNHLFVILFLSWTLFTVVKLAKATILQKYDISTEDNLKSRKVHTQINILERLIIFLIILFAVGFILLSFEKIREIGLGLFASAGLAGIIIGLAAQKAIITVLAGLQIAFTQPFRIEDAVFVENEWGWIEEINLTYIVVRIWDRRRLVLPTTYFLENPFQNWTRSSADIIGTIFIYTDYSIPFQALREELTRQLHQTDLWDGNVNVLQVTEAKEYSVEIRILVSARNSPTAWDLRVHIREKLIEFIREHYPESFPKTRIRIDGGKQPAGGA